MRHKRSKAWNPTEYYATPASLIEEILKDEIKFISDHLRRKNLRILEPSAGDGRWLDIIKQLIDKRNREERETIYPILIEVPQYHFCELDRSRYTLCTEKGYTPVGRDFLNYHPESPYDIILMNPPFSVHIEHVMHAWSMLREGGMIYVILPGKYLSVPRTQKEKDFLSFLYAYERFVQPFPNLKFENDIHSVTISVILFCLRKYSENRAGQEYNGYPNFYTWRAEYNMTSYQPIYRLREQFVRNVLDQNIPAQLNHPAFLKEVKRYCEHDLDMALRITRIYTPPEKLDWTCIQRHLLEEIGDERRQREQKKAEKEATTKKIQKKTFPSMLSTTG
ncbi:hypothetical protein EI42_04384 [Thermosporothrix hazakensis]|jgi:hypothetical protein|uniref:Uncharacterized protein n=2 Tax=Thermosporothrix hazakensis TaxID=644383 RepID=A0A326U5N8_THEHA|nr:hypothetical protein [Thermosporothrix hazakensis]PZW25332.1 hypothetical protein EI42_04384 [Thermosporothrix hazakensis]GCE50563.1 hypothetical protein KTH_54320 [Thermosporothrix hazakensis]